jgi:predicted ATP-grasp superfamily ATP-dependent carboligase
MSIRQSPILLVGITARMLAELAVKAGYSVLALDYFGDLDLQALCPSVSLRYDYNQRYSANTLVDAATELTAPYVIYGASLENHPAEVARLAGGRELLGNDPSTLEQVRDPLLLADALKAGGFAFPATFVPESDITADRTRRWLWKPRRSGGGHGIYPWRPGGNLQPDGVLQERLAGIVGSAVFVADGRQAVLLGLTEQLVGRRAFGASGFGYCGNLVPPRLKPSELSPLLREMQAVVTHLTKTFGLRGLNGLDFIWHRGRAWCVEVNPRPSASLELIDLAYSIRVFDAHVRAFGGELPAFDLGEALKSSPAAGKAILFAARDVRLNDTDRWVAQGIRDVPHAGEQIKARHPVCTILATAATPMACLRQLWSKAAKLKRQLKNLPPP